jgi:hypothetical protein
MNQYIVKSAYRASGGSLLTDHCSGAFLNEVRRSVLLTVMLGLIVVLATGCSSTGTGFNARLISPIHTNQQGSEDDGSYQPVRNPAFSDFFGS